MRLVNWNVEMLSKLLRTMVARREASGIRPDPQEIVEELEFGSSRSGKLALDEVKDVIELPKYDANAAELQVDEKSIELDEAAVSQLQLYVQTISALYPQNGFHK
jgi:hypothetical protein